MKFAEKKEAYAKLQDASMLEKDIALLKIKKPDSTLLQISTVNREKSQRDILWELLDVATVEDITGNRRLETGKESHSDQDIDIKNAARTKAIEKLLALDLEKATQPVMANLVRALDIVPINFKAATIRPILAEELAKLFKEPAPENTSVNDANKVNELEAENEELKSENDDLQEQLEDAEAEKEDLQEQLEEEKKSAADQE